MNSIPFKPTLWTLIFGMTTVALIIMLTTLFLVYRAAYSAQLTDLGESTKILASVIESVAQFDQQFSNIDHPEGARSATISQIENTIAFQTYHRPSQELTIAFLEGDTIRLMRQNPDGSGIEDVTRLPNDGILAQPQFHALKNETGSGEMLDYLGVPVLAGYAPVPTLNIGLVYKIDLAEVRAPFYRAASWASLIGVAMVTLGAFGFSIIIRPLARRTEDAQKRYALVEDAVQDGIWDWNILTGKDYLSPKWKAILGYDENELPNHESSFFDLVHPEDAENAAEAVRLHLEEGKRFNTEIRMRHKDGTYRWVLSRGEAIRHPSKPPERMVGAITDITERKKVEEDLQKSESRLEEAQRISHVGNWEWNIITNDLYWSDEIYRIFGLLPQQFHATYDAFLETVHPDDRDELNNAVNVALDGGKSYKIDHRIVLPTGEEREVNEQAKVSFDAEGKPIRMAGTVQDITDRNRIAQILNASLAEKEVLLKEIHHRVKNNLQIISSLLNLQSAKINDEEVQSMFMESQSRVTAMALIHEKLYRSDDLAGINFAEYLQSLVDSLAQSYTSPYQSTRIDVTVEDISLEIDTAIPCALIVNELVSNALKHAFPHDALPREDQNRIHVEMTRTDNDEINLSVSDNGCGFPDELDFKNSDSLGMQIVDTLTNQLDGIIELENKNGAVFTAQFTEIKQEAGV